MSERKVFIGKLCIEQKGDSSEYTVSMVPMTEEEMDTLAGIVRCRNCRWADEAPAVEGFHLECRLRPLARHYTDDDGYCHMGERRSY